MSRTSNVSDFLCLIRLVIEGPKSLTLINKVRYDLLKSRIKDITVVQLIKVSDLVNDLLYLAPNLKFGPIGGSTYRSLKLGQWLKLFWSQTLNLGQ